MIPVVMSGGSGTRLWPVSRSEFPKQFCHLFDESLQFKTTHRLSRLGSPWTLTTSSLRVMTERTLRDLNVPVEQVIYEPFGRNTAAAIALACHLFQKKGWSEEVVGIFPSDHLVEDVDGFCRAVSLAEECAKEGQVVTLGIQPTYAATGYGYIETQTETFKEKDDCQARWAKRFCEKPDEKTAQEFVQDGRFFWNAGMFVFQVQTMAGHFEKFLPGLWADISRVKEDLSNVEEVYSKIEKLSIDYGVMERLEKLVCIPADIGWSDVGSWEEMAKVAEGAENVISEDSKENFVFSKSDKLYSLLGVENLIVVDTEDAVLIAKKGYSQEVKKVVERLNSAKDRRSEEHVFTYRPWGKYEILRDTDLYKSKVITVDPGQRLSYQSHDRRSEHWVVVSGQGELTLNDETRSVERGDYIFIPRKAKHRMACTGTESLQFLEVQIGDYFGEDDIVRYQDDYNR